MQTHEDWMQYALNLAKATEGQTGSNPLVGAVIIRQGRVVGQGAHLQMGTAHAEVHALQMGTAHAEVHALQMAGKHANGGTIYVTLEPCNHHGRTPPCTEAILKSGIRRVIVGSTDPDTRVAGAGIRRLQQAGLEVITDVLKEKCDQLNEAYFHHRLTGLPYVTLKLATTLDGKIATHTGDSRWITNRCSRQRAHEMRDQHQAILVGVGTVIADDPVLTTRLEPEGKNPMRIIVDSQLRTPIEAKIVDTSVAPTFIATTEQVMQTERATQLQERGVQLISSGAGSRVNLAQLLRKLGENGLLSLLVEGGSSIHGSLLAAGHVQKVVSFIAPKLLGGTLSLTAIGGPNPNLMAEAVELTNIHWEQLSSDLCLTGYVKTK